MPDISQKNRPIAITTPLGDDKLLLERISGKEGISRLFGFELVLLAQPGYVVPFDQLLGQAVTVRINNLTGDPRYFNGVVSRLSEGLEVRAPDTGDVFLRYFAQIVPAFWLLASQQQSRIFQQLSVPDILKKVLAGLTVSYELQGTYDPRNYCVQYRESDFQFASRLMEEEGIRYYFAHSSSAHTMHITDTASGLTDLPGGSSIDFNDFRGLRDARTQDERVMGWQKSQEMRSGKYTLRDHYFEDSVKTLEATQTVLANVASGTVTHKLKVGGNDNREIYDFPGGYVRRYDGIDPGGADRAANVVGDSERTVKIRMEQETSAAVSISADSNVRRLVPGYQFTLGKHFNANGNYLITDVEHSASIEGTYSTNETVPLRYSNRFSCVPAALPYRPARSTAKPRVQGSQTAVVVGEAGAEIATDKYGRVKVQFFWDRVGTNDANSSCWIRVAQAWAGKLWGSIVLPRIGQEVVVDFLEGDPDQPIIVGCVYNDQFMPPYKLPDNMTRSTFKTRSSAGGTDENFNELRFEDLKDKEEIFFHAERDFNREVENNDTLKVGFDKKDPGDQTIEIYHNRTERVQEGDEKVTIEKGNRTVTVKKDDKHEVQEGNLTVLVDQGDHAHTVSQGKSSYEVTQGVLSWKVTAGDATYDITAGTSSTSAGTKIEFKVGSNSIVIDQMGITIKATMISIEASGNLTAKGVNTTVNGDAALVLKGGTVAIN